MAETFEHNLRMNFLGRLRHTKVAAQDAFLPLFEAVVNSIHSTQDRFGEHVDTMGRVDIHIHRVKQQVLPGTVGRAPIEDIEAITVIDNGDGFTDENMRSFETADSDAKLDRGGKGVGRLTWLVVFQRAEIQSTFGNSIGNRVRRKFTFSRTPAGITEFDEASISSDNEIETRVRLIGVLPPYSGTLRKGTEVVAERVFEHCFNYFVLGRCPRVLLVDENVDGHNSILLNERCEELTLSAIQSLKVSGHDLELRHVRQPHATGRRHLAHLLANDRVVSSFSLADVSELTNDPICGASGEPQVHHVYVGGAALNAAADSTRTHFSLPDGEPLLEEAGSLDLKTLRLAVGLRVNEHLAPALAAQRDETYRKVQQHIRTKQPEYARLLEQKREQLSRIRWSDNLRHIDESLYKLKQTWDWEIKSELSQVEQKLVSEKTEVGELAEQFYRVVSASNLAGQDDLVRYVIKRRAVLQLLTQLTAKFRNTVEADIHKIVFPLRRTNGQVDYDDHNLWLVDDTLSFYEFVASDIRFDQLEAAGIESQKRPDILAFKTGDPFQHVSLVEFKKPDRKDHQNPVEQLAGYARLLRKGGTVDGRGVTMPKVGANVRIDAYAIVTLDPQMEDLLRDGPGEMKEVEGESRWYGGLSNLNMTVEVLDFTAFVRRAQQRNQAFFRALNLSM